MNSYDLSRVWFEFCFNNPEQIKPIHSAIYFFAIEHCNRLGWKDKFGFPSQMVMEAIGVKNWRTYSKALNEVVSFGFIEMIETSKNQYSSNIIAIVKNTKAPTKALDKALSKHSQKQGTKHSQSTVSINKQETKNKEQETIDSFKEKWHSLDLKKIRTFNEGRKNKLLQRVKTFKGFDELFEKIPCQLSYLKSQPWFGIDWIIKNDENWEKVLEQNYKQSDTNLFNQKQNQGFNNSEYTEGW